MAKSIELVTEGLTKKIAEEIDRRLSANPHIKHIHADVQAHRIHVTFDEGMISAEDVRRLVLGCGCHCTHSKKTREEMACCRPAGKGMERLAGEEQRLAVSAGAHAEHLQHEFKIKERAPEKAGAEKAHEYAKEMGWWGRFKMNMGMTMDMQHAGDRSMMKMMEDSVRTRFLFSLLLTIPVILYSPLATNTFGLRLYSPIPVNWLLFLLTTPIVLYGGWIFIYGTYVYSVKGGNNRKIFDAPEWLAAMCSHVPNRGEQMVRYYGFYSNVSRGKRQKSAEDTAIPHITESDRSPAACRKNWARLIQKIYEVDPLTCPKCRGTMRIISFIEGREVIKTILQYLGIWTIRSRPHAKAHAPPAREFAVDGSSHTAFPDHAVYGDPDYSWDAYITT